MSKKVKDFLINKYFDPNFGASSLYNVFEQLVEDCLEEGFKDREFSQGDQLEAIVIGDELVLQMQHRAQVLPSTKLFKSKPKSSKSLRKQMPGELKKQAKGMAVKLSKLSSKEQRAAKKRKLR